MDANETQGKTAPVVDSRAPATNINKRRCSEQCARNNEPPAKQWCNAVLKPADHDNPDSTNGPERSDEEDLLMTSLQQGNDYTGTEPDVPATIFNPLNPKSTIHSGAPRNFRIVKITNDPQSDISNASLSTTSHDWQTSSSLINGRSLDEVFTGDARQITDSTLYELCKRFTIPSIIERTNLGRQPDGVSEPMLRKRLRDYKKKLLASGSQCAYEFEYVLNKSRHEDGQRGVRMPSVKLKCGKCPTCLRWHDPVKPRKVFEYWTRSQFGGETHVGEEVITAAKAAESVSRFQALQSRPEQTPKRKRTGCELPHRGQNGSYADAQIWSAATPATKKIKHSPKDSPIPISDSSSDGDPNSQIRKVPRLSASYRQPWASKSTDSIAISQAERETSGIPEQQVGGIRLVNKNVKITDYFVRSGSKEGLKELGDTLDLGALFD